jgi:glycosyltransferase involved in cell wall biosynthesis
MVKTRENLAPLGIRADISTELEPDLSAYDIVHIFNLVRPQEAYLQAANARRQGKKVALSTIYVSYAEFEKKMRGGFAGIASRLLGPSQTEYLKVAARACKNREYSKGTVSLLLHGYRKLQERILDMTDILLPNSASEMRRLVNDFPSASRKPFIIVPNGFDGMLFAGKPAASTPEIEKYRGCILCVARIEALKNQLDLVRAMRGLPWPLVLIGRHAPNHVRYRDRIRAEAGPNVHILGPVDHEMLPPYYRAARVHALVSWMETTGLSSLEAGAMGCQLVITDKGDTREYFGDYAYYCDPASVESIRSAIITAYISSPNSGLKNHLWSNFTWDKTAMKTLEGYRLVHGPGRSTVSEMSNFKNTTFAGRMVV